MDFKKNIGKRADFLLKDGTRISGRIMNVQDNIILLKLSNGYNIGILTDEIKEVKKVNSEEAKDMGRKENSNHHIKTEGIRDNNEKKLKIKISIIHTGGTIASKVDYKTGAVVARFKPEDILKMFPELKNIADINSRLIGNMLSENMRAEHYNLIAKAVKEELENGSDGVIITHGTDTMHYTSSALSFILEGLNKPVVLVGAQRSSDRASSDAYLNLVNTAYFIKKTRMPGVYVCMHNSINDDDSVIISGTKARKMHSSRRDAFKSINTKPVALINYKENKVKMLNKPKVGETNNKLRLKLFNPKLKVGLLKSFPGITHELIDFFKNYDGLVIEGTGLGHLPIVKSDEFTEENNRVFESLKNLSRKMPVVISTQTIYGRVNMNVYSPGRMLLSIGILGNFSDMTPETAFIKLWWLLSNYSKEEIRKENLILKNFRGEITDRSDESFNIIES